MAFAHNLNPDHITALLRETAAAHILPLHKNLQSHQINTKSGPMDLVTEADIAAEAALTPLLKNILPGSHVIGEEATAKDPHLPKALNGDGVFWIIDPVDGTRNFVNGGDDFGMILALVVDGVTQWGWVYFPLTDDIAIAQKGEGASWNGAVVIRQDQGRALGNLIGDYAGRHMRSRHRKLFQDTAPKLGDLVDTGCAARLYADIARGGIDFAIWGKIAPWDHAAGVLLLEETGGKTAFTEDGALYKPLPYEDAPMLSVGDANIWRDTRAVLAGEG